MHIMEGFLPHPWWEILFLASAPFVIYGVSRINQMTRERREALPLLAVAGAFVFVLSSLKLPSVTGSCSHPTGTGIGAILFGTWITSVLAAIVLIYQAVFLAHGGLSTLGANVFSMGVAGPAAAYLIYRASSRAGLNFYLGVFAATAVADMITYLVTAMQLALAFPSSSGSVLESFWAFSAVFSLTQLPLALLEGVVAALMFKYILQLRGDVLLRLNVLSESALGRLREGLS